MPYEAEEIPNKDYLFRRIHKSQIDLVNDKPGSGAFSDSGDGMSTDWDKYSTPHETRNRIKTNTDPLDYGIVRLNTGMIRNIEDQEVIHTPEDYNRAHTDIIGKKKLRIKKEFKKIAEWVFRPDEP